MSKPLLIKNTEKHNAIGGLKSTDSNSPCKATVANKTVISQFKFVQACQVVQTSGFEGLNPVVVEFEPLQLF